MQSTECIVTTPGDEQLEAVTFGRSRRSCFERLCGWKLLQVQRCPSSISWKKDLHLEAPVNCTVYT